jgi:hypothetical protein
MKKAQVKPVTEMQMYYRRDGDKFRVWKNTWGFDQFEVLSEEDFQTLMKVCIRFSIVLREYEDED